MILVSSIPILKDLETILNDDLFYYSDWLRYSTLSININKTLHKCIKQKISLYMVEKLNLTIIYYHQLHTIRTTDYILTKT